MENYNNYQEVINALKAKYVDARNLKSQAKAKRREILNSGSFLTRKETEKTVTDTKSESIGNLIDSTMGNSFESIETGKQNKYRIELAELKAELALIDAQMSKLMEFNEIDPEAHPEKTDAELQSLNLVRGMINNAIYQAESTFEEAYSNSNYLAIKDQFSPGIGTSTDEEIRDHYGSLDSKFVSLFNEAKSAIDGFVIEYKDLTLAARDLKRNLYGGISNIEFLKSQLSDLLQNGGSESEISAKESDIESEKETLLNKANDLKRKNTERNVLVNFFGDKVSTYFDSLDEMRSGMRGFFQSNSQILISHYPNTDYKIQERMLELTNSFLVCLEEFFGTIPDGNGNYYSLFEILNGDFKETGDVWTQERRMGLYSNDMTETIDSPMNRLFTNTEDENGNPSFEFKKQVSEESKEEIIEYYDRLNSAFSPYMERMASILFERNKIWDTFNKLDELESKHLEFTQVFSRSISDLKWSEREAYNFYQGRYTGTPEQESLYSSAFDSMISAERDYELTKQVANIASLKWARFNHIFPEFYSSLDPLLSAKSNTQSAFDSAEAQKLVLISEDNTAYDLLQTLTAGETSYLQALYDYEKNSNEVQLAINGNNLLVAAANQSYDFLQTTLSGEAEYQAAYPFESYGSIGSVNNSFAYGSGFDNYVTSTVTQTDGKILVVGAFENYNGTLAKSIIRLNPDGSIDTSFITGTGFVGTAATIAIQSDGKILVGGEYSSYNGTSVIRIIRLNSDGSIDTSFVTGTGFNGMVEEITVQSDGKILVGGAFQGLIQGTSANRIIRLNSDGSVDASFVTGTGFDGEVYEIIVQSDGKIVVGGGFVNYNGTNAEKIIRLNSDGSRDTSFVIGTGFNGDIYSIGIQTDGKIVIGGGFGIYNGTSANNIIRLNSDGSIDTSFVIGSGMVGQVTSVAIQTDGKLLVGGQFDSYNGTSANKIIQLNSDGSVDTSFVSGTGFSGGKDVGGIIIQSNGSIIIIGSFTTYNGISANRIVMFSGSGSYPQTEIDRITALHYVYLGAQSDYDTKDAARIADYETNVAPFIVLRDNALVALQDLTDEDAAYQSALSDWTNKNTVKNDFINTVWLSASNDRDAAIVAYNSHVGGSYSFENMINVSGQFLVDVLDARNLNVELMQNGVKYNAWMDANSAYEQIQSQMTFEPASDADKLNARRDFLPMEYRAYKVRQWWLAKVVEHLQYLHNYKNQFFEAVDFINSMSDSETDSILQDGIDFLTNTQQNLRYRKQWDQYFHDFKGYESNLRKNHNRLVAQGIDSLGTLMSQADPDADLLTTMRSSTFVQTVQSMFGDMLLEGAHSGFANSVIGWVETGGEFNG